MFLFLFPVIIFFFALICEFIDSHLGGGYGTILTPVFLMLGISRMTIVHSILISEIITGFQGGAIYHSFKKVDFKSCNYLSITAGIGSIIGTLIAITVPSSAIKIYIAFLVLILGLMMILKVRARKYKPKRALSIGSFIGFNKALTGGGFGPVAVAGLSASGMETKKSLGTTLLAEGITCVISLMLYLALGKISIVPSFLIPLIMGAIIGCYIGGNTSKKTKSRSLYKRVGIMLLCIGIFMVIKELVL